jgi:L-rhamnose isomerase
LCDVLDDAKSYICGAFESEANLDAVEPKLFGIGPESYVLVACNSGKVSEFKSDGRGLGYRRSQKVCVAD